jgi:hypothetical protein
MKAMNEMALRCGRGVNVGRLGLSHEKFIFWICTIALSALVNARALICRR